MGQTLESQLDTLDFGTTPDDGTGETLREGAIGLNANDILLAGAVDDLLADSIEAATVLWRKQDSISFTFGLGSGSTGDTVVMVDNANMGVFLNQLDTLTSLQVKSWCIGSGGDVTIRGFHGTDPTAAGTAMFDTEQVTTAGGVQTVSTFSSGQILRGEWVWFEIVTAAEGSKPTMLVSSYIFRRK